MKRFGKRKLRIKMQLTVFKSGRMTYRTTKQKKASIFKEIRVFQTQNPNKWLIRVVYGTAKNCSGEIAEVCNAGEYATVEDLLYALKLFTEKPLLDETELWLKGESHE